MGKSTFALVGGRVVTGGSIKSDVTVVVSGGTIAAITPVAELDASVRRVEVAGCYVTPGLIDVHTHGAAGATFAEPDETAYGTALAAHAQAGVTALHASLASAPIPELEGTLRFVAAQRARFAGGTALLGAHLEGPFLAQAQRGAHNPVALRPPEQDVVTRLLEHADVLSMITLAPELPGALDAVRRFSAAGTVVAAGHSEASGADLAAAQRAGLAHLTHLWSGQSALRREGPWRVPGLLEESLASDGLTGEVIADGAHLPPALVRIALRCLGSKLCVVSDATAGAGMPEGSRYELGGIACEVRDGVGMLVGADLFAGSTTLLNTMVRWLRDAVGVPLATAIAMATEVPARVIGIDHRKGRLHPGFDADIAVFDEEMQALGTLVGGAWVYDVGLADVRPAAGARGAVPG